MKHISAHLEEVALGAVSHRADVDSEQGAAGTDTEEDLDQDQDRDDDDDESTEDKWCFCQTASYGTMLKCSNKHCEVSWFHSRCVGFSLEAEVIPDSWYCSVCTVRRENDERGIRACYHCRDRKIECIPPDTTTRCFGCANNHLVCQFPGEGHPRPSSVEPTPNRIELSGNQEKPDGLYTEALLENANMTKSDINDGKASPSIHDNDSVPVPDLKIDDVDLDWDQIIPDEQLASLKAEEEKKKNDEYLSMAQEESVPRKAAPKGFEKVHIEFSRGDSPEGFIERFEQPPASSLDRPGSPSLDESFTWVNESRRSPVKSTSLQETPHSPRPPPALPSHSTAYSPTKPRTELSDKDSSGPKPSDVELQILRAMEERLKVQNERIKACTEQVKSQLGSPVFATDPGLSLQRLRAETEQLKALLASYDTSSSDFQLSPRHSHVKDETDTRNLPDSEKAEKHMAYVERTRVEQLIARTQIEVSIAHIQVDQAIALTKREQGKVLRGLTQKNALAHSDPLADTVDEDSTRLKERVAVSVAQSGNHPDLHDAATGGHDSPSSGTKRGPVSDTQDSKAEAAQSKAPASLVTSFIACNNCRRAKLRCSSADRCARCIAQGISCVRDSRSARRSARATAGLQTNVAG